MQPFSPLTPIRNAFIPRCSKRRITPVFIYFLYCCYLRLSSPFHINTLLYAYILFRKFVSIIYTVRNVIIVVKSFFFFLLPNAFIFFRVILFIPSIFFCVIRNNKVDGISYRIGRTKEKKSNSNFSRNKKKCRFETK